MKKELRKFGFVLVAATSMLAFSCGGAEEPTTETPAETPTETPAETPVEEPVTEPVTEDTSAAAACDAGACEAGACEGADKPAAH